MFRIRCGCGNEKITKVEVAHIPPRIAEVTEDRTTLRISPDLFYAPHSIRVMVASHEGFHLCYPYIEKIAKSEIDKVKKVFTEYQLLPQILLSVLQSLVNEAGLNIKVSDSISAYVQEEAIAYVIGYSFIGINSPEAMKVYAPELSDLIDEYADFIRELYDIAHRIVVKACFFETYQDVLNAINTALLNPNK